MARGYPDFEGGKAKLFTVAEWAALEGKAVTYRTAVENKGWHEIAIIYDDLDIAFDLYITFISVSCKATNEADADNNQFCHAYISANGQKFERSSNGGFAILLNPPIKVSKGDNWQYALIPESNHNVNLVMIIRGYKIEV